MSAEPSNIACKLDSPELARRKAWITDEVISRADHIGELDDGVLLRFDDADAHSATVLQLVELERRCCPFITFTVRYDAEQGPLTLLLTGSPETKAFIRAELRVQMRGSQ